MAITAAEQEFINELHDCALEYLERGWSFFPVSISSKKPLNEWKQYQSRKPTIDEVNDWFTNGAPTKDEGRQKFFNLCLVTGSISGVVVLDCDNDNAVDFAMENRLASPFAVKTTRGMHFYFKHPNHSERYANKVGGVSRDWTDIKGVDFRGDGGYAILPPSVSFNPDGSFKHQYEFEDCGMDWDSLPKWTYSKPTLTDTESKEFSFENLDLSDTKVATKESMFTVWEQTEEHVRKQGKMSEGGGRNQWLIKYAGEQVRKGVVGEELVEACLTYMDRFFIIPLDNIEFKRTLQSAEEMDRANYPQDYTESGERINKQKEALEKAYKSIIIMDDIDEMETKLSKQRYFADPVVAPGTITQIVGYNGHGKSLAAYGMSFAMANGINYGPYEVTAKAKVLYFDYETPAQTFVDRMRDFKSLYGNPHMNLQVMLSAYNDNDFHFSTNDGIATALNTIEKVQPQVVVIDTVRSAYQGVIEEKDPKFWAGLNAIAKEIRNAGIAVVIVHHRNKPGEHGLGREAGSTAQLTDIDTQLFITSVYRNEEDAKKKAALHDSKLTVQDSKGRGWTPFGYLENTLDLTNWRILYISQFDFGKVRQLTDNHAEAYLAMAENIFTGEKQILHTPSPLQKAKLLSSHGTPLHEIAQKLMIPKRVLEGWLK